MNTSKDKYIQLVKFLRRVYEIENIYCATCGLKDICHWRESPLDLSNYDCKNSRFYAGSVSPQPCRSVRNKERVEELIELLPSQ